MINELEHLLAQTSTSALIGSLSMELKRLETVEDEKAKPFREGTEKHLKSMQHVLTHLIVTEKELRTLLSVNFNLHKQVMELMNENEKMKLENANLMQGL